MFVVHFAWVLPLYRRLAIWLGSEDHRLRLLLLEREETDQLRERDPRW
jgi:hypothetical protein